MHETNEYDTNNPNSIYLISFIREKRTQYKDEIHRCCNICICILGTVIASIVTAVTLSVYFVEKKQ